MSEQSQARSSVIGQVTEDELRKAWALTIADALRWTRNPTEMQLGVIREGALRLVRSDPLTVHEEGEFQRALLEAGCWLTGPYERPSVAPRAPSRAGGNPEVAVHGRGAEGAERMTGHPRRDTSDSRVYAQSSGYDAGFDPVAAGQLWTDNLTEVRSPNRIIVRRVARDGSWADIRVEQHSGARWGKRMPLPFPSAWSRLR